MIINYMEINRQNVYRIIVKIWYLCNYAKYIGSKDNVRILL